MSETRASTKVGFLTELTMAHAEDRTASWRAMREQGEVWEISPGLWMLTSAEAVNVAHRNPALFSNVGVMHIHDLPVRPVPGSVDPPEHRELRKLLDPMLAPRVINAMEDELRAQIRDLVSGLASRGGCDAIADLAVLYPTEVFLSVFGLPVADRDLLVGWVKAMVERDPAGDGAANGARDAAWELYRYVEACVAEKRADPGDDMLSRILALDGDDAWPDEDVIGLCLLFSMAGLDTVTGAIGFMLHALACDPDLRRQTIADPAARDKMIEEVLRLEPSAPMFPRIATQDVEVCGVTIPAGSITLLVLASANRDEARYDHPDRIDLGQADRGHVTFGGGVHRCLGSHLARRELRLVFEELHAQIPDYEVAPGFEPAVAWPSGTLHLEALPLVFPPERRRADDPPERRRAHDPPERRSADDIS